MNTTLADFAVLCSCSISGASAGGSSVARLCLEPTLMATELATPWPGAQGSHLLLLTGVDTNVYCIPCFLRVLTRTYIVFLSLSRVVWRFCRLLCSVAFAILCHVTVRVMDYCLTELIAKMGECPLAMHASSLRGSHDSHAL